MQLLRIGGGGSMPLLNALDQTTWSRVGGWDEKTATPYGIIITTQWYNLTLEMSNTYSPFECAEQQFNWRTLKVKKYTVKK